MDKIVEAKATETVVKETVKNFIADFQQEKNENSKELIILTGEKDKTIFPDPVQLNGVISAPAEFWKKRKTGHNPDKCHVVYDKTKGTIKLVIDEQNSEYNYTVSGSLIENPDLAPFCINKHKFFTDKELMELLKMNRVHFVDKDKMASVVVALKNFKVKVESEIVNANDQKGTENYAVARKISDMEQSITESFKLQMPLLKGASSVQFVVEVCVQISNSSVLFYLESVDLKESMDKAKGMAITNELLNFTDIVCIEQ